mmetsp:Transcript_7854/g.11827  ORF Transcript_7854/g.11827 Transcript_7854/m.11827 type:complete len:238 (+) Transcript_7854:274-987(+)
MSMLSSMAINSAAPAIVAGFFPCNVPFFDACFAMSSAKLLTLGDTLNSFAYLITSSPGFRFFMRNFNIFLCFFILKIALLNCFFVKFFDVLFMIWSISRDTPICLAATKKHAAISASFLSPLKSFWISGFSFPSAGCFMSSIVLYICLTVSVCTFCSESFPVNVFISLYASSNFLCLAVCLSTIPVEYVFPEGCGATVRERTCPSFSGPPTRFGSPPRFELESLNVLHSLFSETTYL